MKFTESPQGYSQANDESTKNSDPYDSKVSDVIGISLGSYGERAKAHEAPLAELAAANVSTEHES